MNGQTGAYGLIRVEAQMIAMRQDGATLERIAQATGVSDETVRRDTESALSNDKAEKVLGKDGKVNFRVSESSKESDE
jgi:DeoR/GlpR family transcriptional regulator of sugar metabolism